MKSNDYVKFLTEQFILYMEQPREQRRSTRMERKQQRPPVVNRWFGLLPWAFSQYAKKWQGRVNRTNRYISEVRRRWK